MKKLTFLIIIFFISGSLQALELKGTFYQGNLIVGKTEPGSEVIVDKKKIKVSTKGFFVIGISKNRKKDITIEIFKNGLPEKFIKKVYKKNIKFKE